MTGQKIIYLCLVFIFHDFVNGSPKIDGLSRSNSVKTKIKNKSRQGLLQSAEGDSKEGLIGQVGHERQTTSEEKHNENDGHLFDDDASEYDYTVEQTEYVEDENDYIEPETQQDSDLKKKETRSLAVGDVFTTAEFLILAEKLMEKVTVTNGRGIVSSSADPFVLAEKLFRTFFNTMQRITIIREYDIPGLDALQALSLHGDVVHRLRSPAESITETPEILINGISQKVDFTLRCHYKVLRKLVDTEKKNATAKTVKGLKTKRRQLIAKILKRLKKNRKLVVNAARRGKGNNVKKNNHNKKNVKKPSSKRTGRINKRKRVPAARHIKKTRNVIETSTTKNGFEALLKLYKFGNQSDIVCRWKYECPGYGLSSCRLYPKCMHKSDKVKFQDDEDTITLQQFRKMAGIDVIDEEVEKIFEMRIGMFTAMNKKKHIDMEVMETIGDYFLRMMHPRGSTPPIVRNDLNEEKGYTRKMKVVREDSDAEARKILGVTGPPNLKQY